jgi:gliding motility-associated-like protein
MRLCVGCVLVVLFNVADVWAQRIYGGQIDRRILNTTIAYSYGVECVFFADKAGADVLPAQLRFGVYRQKNNELVIEYLANKLTEPNGSLSATSCDKTSKTEYFSVKYSHNLVLKPQEFTDSEGYYVVNQPVGPRNPSDNVASTDIVLYHWFSPRYLWEYFEPVEQGKTTPQWTPSSFNYFCANAETNFSLTVTSVPLKTGLNTRTFNLDIANAAPLTGGGTPPYQAVGWKAGFSANNMIPGGNFVLPGRTPNIFGNQGQTSIVIAAKPTKKGVYSVGFLLKHSRDGVLLSQTYREYQIEVEECLPRPPAAIRLSQIGQPATTASAKICEGKGVQLNAGANLPNVTYEWWKDGVKIANAKDSILVVKEKGEYSAVLTRKGACEPNSTPPTVITVVSNPSVKTVASLSNGLLCAGGSILLTAVPSTETVKYQWRKDDRSLSTATTKQYEAKEVGKYEVEVTDDNGCSARSDQFEIKPAVQTLVQMKAIAPTCPDDTTAIGLEATPTGGVFEGRGVTDNRFKPSEAGAGKHEITYTIDGKSSCITGKTSQIVQVNALPVVDLGPDVVISGNKSVRLSTNLMGDYRYRWSPTIGLDNPQSSNPVANPDKSTQYFLRLTDANGCTTTDSVWVNVVKGLAIPEAFSPNDDGLNDVWQIKGLEEFPDARISVYDRWGAVVYETTDAATFFDGTYKGVKLPTGVYVYYLKTTAHAYRGTLLLIR